MVRALRHAAPLSAPIAVVFSAPGPAFRCRTKPVDQLAPSRTS